MGNDFQDLKLLAEKYARHVRALPSETDDVETRNLMCFSVMGQRLVVAIEEIAEILELQLCTRLPRVKSWVSGVTNVRGKLLPVIDFAEFLGGKLRTAPKLQRIVVIEHQGHYVGLVVDEVKGMRHFPVDGFSEADGSMPEVFSPFVEGMFSLEGEKWFLLRPPKLLNEQTFLEVAA
ncbi:MAG: chemotaxis protein CheW [bacterium]